VAQDLSVIVQPAGGLNQHGTAAPGVCISTDKGLHFYSVAFAGVPANASTAGPKGVVCTDKDHCHAYNGQEFDAGTAQIYYTANASMGKASTWTAAAVPSAFATSSEITLQAMFFAPDGAHGWCAGNNDRKPLLLRTTDGGHTWTDVSSQISAITSNELYGGFALDNDHVWAVGRNGTLVATSTAQQ